MTDSHEADTAPIRQLRERAEIYRTVSVSVAFVAGSLSLVASALLLWRLRSTGALLVDPGLFHGAWAGVVIASLAVAFTGLKMRAANDGSSSGDRARFAVGTVMPHALTAVVLGLLLSWRGSAFSLVTSWLVLYGLALLATRPFAPPSLATLGKAFLITGLGLMLFVYFRLRLLIGYDRSDEQTLLLMAATFGLYHLAYAVGVTMKKPPR